MELYRELDSRSPSDIDKKKNHQRHSSFQNFTMSTASPRFWAAPLTYLRWSMRERPAYFWSVVIGAAGPVFIFGAPPLRHALGDPDAPKVPNVYPIPKGARKQLKGYDDE